MKVLRADQARQFDDWAINEAGVCSLLLMENAARAVVDEILRLRSSGNFANRRGVAIICGPGNNGADGVAVSRLLASEGVSSRCWLAGTPRDGSDLAAQLNMARSLGIAVQQDVPNASDLSSAGLCVDALFGTGLSRPLEGRYADLVAAVNSAHGKVLAVDLPSGLDASRGVILGPTVRADYTVTFPLPKVAHYLFPAAAQCGVVVNRSLGVPVQAWLGQVSGESKSIELILESRVAEELPSRPADAHKGTFGRVLVVAGSAGLEGASALTASAAVAGGAGLVSLFVPRVCLGHSQVRPEIMVSGIGSAGAAAFGASDQIAVEAAAGDQNAIVIGPGLGSCEETTGFAAGLVASWKGPMVVDADGLRVFRKSGAGPRPEVVRHVLTPHPGELSRMLEGTIESVKADPLSSASEAAERWNAVVVLKGRSTVIACPDGQRWINTTGGPLLASGGSGDVLAGLIGALLGAGLSPSAAARSGVFVHGLAADRLTRRVARVGLGASAVIAEIPAALEHCYQLADASRADSEPLL